MSVASRPARPRRVLPWALFASLSVLLGASRIEQIEDSMKALDGLDFEAGELEQIDRILAER